MRTSRNIRINSKRRKKRKRIQSKIRIGKDVKEVINKKKRKRQLRRRLLRKRVRERISTGRKPKMRIPTQSSFQSVRTRLRLCLNLTSK